MSKELLKSVERIIAETGRKTAEKAAGSASWPFLYQPKEPDAVRNMRRCGKRSGR